VDAKERAARAVETQSLAEKAAGHVISAYTRAVPSHDSAVYKVVGQQRAAAAVLDLLVDLGWSPPSDKES
jgi:hypothetical protein